MVLVVTALKEFWLKIKKIINKIKGQALKEVKHISVYILVCSAVQQQWVCALMMTYLFGLWRSFSNFIVGLFFSRFADILQPSFFFLFEQLFTHQTISRNFTEVHRCHPRKWETTRRQLRPIHSSHRTIQCISTPPHLVQDDVYVFCPAYVYVPLVSVAPSPPDARALLTSVLKCWSFHVGSRLPSCCLVSPNPSQSSRCWLHGPCCSICSIVCLLRLDQSLVNGVAKLKKMNQDVMFFEKRKKKKSSLIFTEKPATKGTEMFVLLFDVSSLSDARSLSCQSINQPNFIYITLFIKNTECLF